MKDETKDKIKKILMAVGAGIVSIGSFILGIILYNNGKSAGRAEGVQDRISDSLDGLSNTGKELSGISEEIRESNRELTETNRRFETTNERFGNLIEEISKTKHDSRD